MGYGKSLLHDPITSSLLVTYIKGIVVAMFKNKLQKKGKGSCTTLWKQFY